MLNSTRSSYNLIISAISCKLWSWDYCYYPNWRTMLEVNGTVPIGSLCVLCPTGLGHGMLVSAAFILSSFSQLFSRAVGHHPL